MWARSRTRKLGYALLPATLGTVGVCVAAGLLLWRAGPGNTPPAPGVGPEPSSPVDPLLPGHFDPRPAPDRVGAEVPETSRPPTPVASAGAASAPAELPACAGLRVLDVETDPDGRLTGAWLANDNTSPRLVSLGDQFGGATLTRASLGDDQRTPQVWMSRPHGPCRSLLHIESASDSRSASARPLPTSNSGASEPSDRRRPRVQASDIPQIRRLAGFLQQS
jgi:hypothetical protein